MLIRRLSVAALALAALWPRAEAQDLLDRVAVHGYRGWSFGRTMDNRDANHFLPAERKSDSEIMEFVARNRNAIGYVSGDAHLGADVKAVRLTR